MMTMMMKMIIMIMMMAAAAADDCIHQCCRDPHADGDALLQLSMLALFEYSNHSNILDTVTPYSTDHIYPIFGHHNALPYLS